METEYDIQQNVDEDYRPYAITTSKPLRKAKKVRMFSMVTTINPDN